MGADRGGSTAPRAADRRGARLTQPRPEEKLVETLQDKLDADVELQDIHATRVSVAERLPARG